jgi:serpin B
MPTSTALGPAPSDAVLTADARGARAFSAQLYKSIKKKPEDNVFFSPASVRIALAMTQAGARGETAAEMTKVLSLSPEASDAQAAAGYVLRTWNRRNGAVTLSPDANQWQKQEAESKRETLRVVNRLWGQRGKAFVPAYLDTLKRSFEAPLMQIDFKTAPEASRIEINSQIERATEQKIRDLLPRGIVTNETQLVLTNAVYFKAAWEHAFMDSMTKEDTFHGAKDVKVEMMQQTETLGYAEVGDAKVLELPYASGNMSMFVVLPRAKDGLVKIEASLNEAKLESWTRAPARTMVSVWLPRFTTTSSFSLVETLSAMGMPQAFDGKRADFSGIDGTKELVISAVVHKAFVAVDEKGTEAAAATAVSMNVGGARGKAPELKEFKADHPFLFFIQDKKLGHVLFMGRVVDPTK